MGKRNCKSQKRGSEIQRVYELLLEEGPTTSKEIAFRVKSDFQSIRRRMIRSGRFILNNGKWGVKG